MNDLVGIIRTEAEMEQALDAARRAAGHGSRRAGVEGHRQFNPGWHLALDLRNMLLVSECVARAALERTESRGGHTRDDYPDDGARLAQGQPGLRADRSHRRTGAERAGARPDRAADASRPTPIRPDLLALFERDELVKYLTDEELDE